MNKDTVNTFIKGLNQDVDKSVVSKDSYLDAHNFRITTSKGSSSGAFENILGNKLIGQNYLVSTDTVVTSNTYLVVKEPVTYSGVVYELDDVITGIGGQANFTGGGKLLTLSSSDMLPYDQRICGAKRLRDYIVLFTTSNTSPTPTHGSGRSMIHKLVLDKANEEVSSLTVLYDDNLNFLTGEDTLDFSTANKIKAIARYETPNIQKIYFTDGYNNLRYLDVAKNLTISGSVYTSDDYMPTSMFEFLPEFTPSKPTLTDIVGGSLMSGMVQYSYQLYRLNGAETAFSPVSDMIHIVTDNDFKNNTLLYKGDPESKVSGKGCKLSIVNGSSGYNRLRLVRIHYSTLNSIPLITVANEIEISTSPSTISITDVGNTINSLTLDEFNISSTELFKCGDIASKDNRLFAANIEKIEFKSNTSVLDWDSRAVRFKSASTATVLDSIEDPVTILADLSNWSSYTKEHDGINQFNDSDNDGNAAYYWAYQANGSDLGAEGLNIKIGFVAQDITLDTSNDNTTFYASTPSDTTDISYKNYASPWKDGKLSWQRDEVYRLFIEFGNNRGQSADPKWICDLRMPSLHIAGFDTLAKLTGTNVVTTCLYPIILLKSFPADATWARIHRVKRERPDRSVITQALVIPTWWDGNLASFMPLNALETVNWSTDGGEIVKLVSPEININKNISKQSGDYLEHVSTYGGVGGTIRTNNQWGNYLFYSVYKGKKTTLVPYTANTKTAISDLVNIESSVNDTTYVTLNSRKYTNYIDDNDLALGQKGSSGMLVNYTNPSWSIEGNTYSVVNYKSNVYGSQYGGNTFEDRALNVTIPCSDIITASDINQVVNVRYGDTFINYFDVSPSLIDLSRPEHRGSKSVSIYVPLESSINCDLRHDSSSTHLTYLIPLAHLRQEYAGLHVWPVQPENIFRYDQKDNLYLYNTVYSQQTSAQYGMSAMIDTPSETAFDCLVRASNVKYNGENSDSWTKFNVNEEIEVDSNYGPIRSINAVNDKLLYWQEDGFGILAVNDRSLIQDGNSAELVLGTGGVLARYDYISTSVGILSKEAIVRTENAVYWFYDKDTSIYMFDNKLSNVTKNKAMWSWFANNYSTDYIVHGVYDSKYNDVLFTLYKEDQTGYTINFNEQTDQFTSFYDFVPYMYIDYKDGYLSTKPFVSNHYSLMFNHNSDINPRCRFYSLLPNTDADTINTFDSTVKLIYNDNYPITKVFDNIFYISTAIDESNDVEQYGITFDKVRCYDDYQNTNWVNLTYPTNIMRRERGWTLAVPRNMVDHNYTTSPDIFSDLATTKTWSERIRDKYMILDLSFDNNLETKFVVPFIGCKYRISFR